MAAKTWTLRRGDSDSGTVLAVTGSLDRLDDLADKIAAHGFYAFAASPAEARELCSVATFDVIVVLGDVAEQERHGLRSKGPPLSNTLLFLEPAEEPEMIERIRAQLISAQALAKRLLLDP